MADYYTIITNIGKAKITNAQVLGGKVAFKYIGIGDGAGEPTENQIALKSEVWRGQVSMVSIDEDNPNWIVIEGIIPSENGGFTVREVGIFDENEDLIAVGKYPVTYKPVLDQGSSKDLYLRMIIEVSNASNIELKVDPTVAIPSQSWVNKRIENAIKDIPGPDMSDYAKKIDLDNHIDKNLSSSAVHGIRSKPGDKRTLQIKNTDGTYEDIKAGSSIKVANVKNLNGEAKSGKRIEVAWTDPIDTTTQNADGEVVTLAKWAGTELRRKEDNANFKDEKDGELVVDNKTRDQYTGGYLDEGLTDGKKYYYMLFPYTNEGAYTVDEKNRVEATAVDKTDQSPPSKPVVSDVEFDRATVTGDSGSVVSLNQVDWFPTPHIFTGLTEETPYTAYAKFEETDTQLESPVSEGNTFETPSEAPGPGTIIAGDENAGFFGEVPASEFFAGSEIASACGISQGTLHNDNEPWLKYIIDGKICFRPRKSIRYSISWDAINVANCVYGDGSAKIVTKDGMQFKVRLMKGALTDPSKSDNSDRGAKGSEWNRIMLPISEKAIDGSWSYKDYVESDIPVWEHGFGSGGRAMYKDSELGFVSGNGYRHWCQETPETSTSNRVSRGHTNGPSYATWNTSSATFTTYGWSPVLEIL